MFFVFEILSNYRYMHCRLTSISHFSRAVAPVWNPGLFNGKIQLSILLPPVKTQLRNLKELLRILHIFLKKNDDSMFVPNSFQSSFPSVYYLHALFE
jgi:hypothetical protein